MRIIKWILPRLLVFVLVLSLAISGIELYLRASAERMPDGMWIVNGFPLLPYKPPVIRATNLLAEYSENQDTTLLQYDEQLGWVPRPGAFSEAHNVIISEQGLRAQIIYSQVPVTNRLRIAVFGDSFSFGEEVSNAETWAQQLEDSLKASNIDAEVLNFGVSGYGMDQAYLRWQEHGYAYQPDVVLFGFVPENAMRNINLFRLLLFPLSSIPFSKPRFLLQDNELLLVNQPTISPEHIPSTLEQIGTLPLMEHEAYTGRYGNTWWQFSIIMSILNYEYAWFNPPTSDEDPFPLSERIIAAFAQDVQAHDAQFWVVYLPPKGALAAGGREENYANFVEVVSQRHNFIDPTTTLLTSEETLYAAEGHYSPRGSAIVAQVIADTLIEQMAE